MIGGAQKQIAGMKGGQTVLNVTHGRNLRVVDSWLKKGAPQDKSVDLNNMTEDGDWSKTGQLLRAAKGGLQPAEDASRPGIYFARHGATNWNAG